MGISRGLRLPSGRKISGVICPTRSARSRKFPGGFVAAALDGALRWLIKYGKASVSFTSTQGSPAPAAQLETGCWSAPGPG